MKNITKEILVFKKKYIFFFLCFVCIRAQSQIINSSFKKTLHDDSENSRFINVNEQFQEVNGTLNITNTDTILFRNYNERLVNNYLTENNSKLNSDEDVSKYSELLKQNLIQTYPSFITKRDSVNKSYKNSLVAIKNGSCVNMDFEQGNYSGWEGLTASACSTSAMPCNQVLGFSTTRHVIMNKTLKDPFIPALSTVYPGGGNFSLRLEDYLSGREAGLANGGYASMARQTFKVDTNNNLFTYHYAVVLEDPGDHNDEERPYFKVMVYDSLNRLLTCSGYSVLAKTSLLSEFKHITYFNPNRTGNTQNMNLYYKDWTTVSIPLNAYIGQNVTIVFAVSDCSRGGHLAYAYIDAQCGKITNPTNLTVCGTTVNSFTASDGFNKYSWSGPGIVAGATSQTVQVNRPGTYSVTLTPFSDNPCPLVLKYLVKQTCPPAPLTTKVCETVKGSFIANNFNLTTLNNAVIGTRTGISVNSWYKGSVTLANKIANPSSISVANNSIYYAVTSYPDTVKLTISVLSRPTATLSQPSDLCKNSNIQLSATPSGGVFTGTNTTNSGFFSGNIAGKYKILYTYKDANGCIDTNSKVIQVLEPVTISVNPLGKMCSDTVKFELKGVANNFSSVKWSGGTGVFSDVNSQTTFYTPSATESQNGGNVTFTFLANGQSPCPAKSVNITATLAQKPKIDITALNPICQTTNSINLISTSTGYSGIALKYNWVGASGTFVNPNSKNTAFNLSSSDKNDSTILHFKLTATGDPICPSVTDTVSVRLVKLGEIVLDSIKTICETDSKITLSFKTTNATFNQWVGNSGTYTKISDGLYSYELTNNDKNLSKLDFVAIANSNSPCTAVMDTTSLLIKKMPKIVVNPLNEICENTDSVFLSASLINADSILWLPKLGVFSRNDSVKTTYKLNDTEVKDTIITFKASAFGAKECASVSDSTKLTIRYIPNIQINSVLPFCRNIDTISLKSNGINYSATNWDIGTGLIIKKQIDSIAFIPTTLEKNTDSLKVRAIASGYSVCPKDTATLTLQFVPMAEVSIQSSNPICETQTQFLLVADTVLSKSIVWKDTSGIILGNNISQTFTISDSDIQNGKKIVVINASSEIPCPVVADTIIQEIVRKPSILGSNIGKFCIDKDSVLVEIQVSNVSNIIWKGSGIFTHPNNDTTLYILSNTEKVTGNIQISVEAVALAPCVNLTENLSGSLVAKPVLSINDIPEICKDVNSISLVGNATNVSSVSWSGGTGKYSLNTNLNSEYTISQNDKKSNKIDFFLTGNGNFPCKPVTVSKPLILHDLPLTFSKSIPYCNEGNTFERLDAGEAKHYFWKHSSDTVRFVNTNEYSDFEVEVTNEFGCKNTRFLHTYEECPPRLFISNAFSPNADGTNDNYTVYGAHIGKFEILIFNRWGEVIFKSDNMHNAWDGTYRDEPMPVGVYEWIIYYEGDTQKYKGPYHKKGSVTVVR